MEYHEPIWCKGLKRMIQKEGFQVLLIDKYKTLNLCPERKFFPLEKFKKSRIQDHTEDR
ncbi:hypothetical protein BCV72DRAFT_110327 [Rhizopus microsporus var. microsporus]|uniref:Uncharacterized protein n=1 Tax=Rhizopus microsporus var. microsporus TaxID=86635 RepID=A0A1X0R5M4_RHIZD|nr:hypothetical protein BCV72DRAFT_110327 [Rhizopus microsporus var. microsporus]